ncbi:YveK family protein [Pediococcus ethanolidurans]|uniref:Capsular polysaccharide biosynthesis protein CpsC n=1 Tax=Pediococcus ethanolidurans TaxID=319653 RepID=A0A0R2JWI7_9LACO|nr:Wzz/FepE/Etk N-terminal domain-containing protein [Pediococcus ethanolidurans]KRN81481.1 capsular polysaccharide biosynthesis protein [Pediococcus ethanolidurans]GEN95262.1 chain-length determining protein [Pediococcus ethanolidurans]SER61073.1 Capsular polysaccharide biosynthesis protein [Pediococcus ethanolidurans]
MDQTGSNVVTFSEILLTLRKHVKLILGTTVIITALAAVVTFFVMTPKYSAGTQILVNRKLDASMAGAQLQTTQADIAMISTYKDIITSPVVQTTVKKQTQNLPGSADSSVSVATETNSQVFTINVTSSNPNTAASVANKTATIFKKRIVKMMSINNVTIVSKAVTNNQPVSPRIKLNLLAGIVLGLILGIGLAFLSEFNDKTVTDESFLIDDLGLTSLGIVNEISQKDIDRQVRDQAAGSERTNKMRRRV